MSKQTIKPVAIETSAKVATSPPKTISADSFKATIMPASTFVPREHDTVPAPVRKFSP